MVISGKSGEAVRGFPLSTVAPALAQVAYPMDRSGARPAETREADTVRENVLATLWTLAITVGAFVALAALCSLSV